MTMKKRNIGVASLAGACLAAAAVWLTGCEVESTEEQEIAVSPQYVELRPGQSATFTAEGWNRFEWSLSNTGIGYLSAQTGGSVTYTALTAPTTTTDTNGNVTSETELRQTITARAAVDTSTNGTTVLTGTAIVRHRP